MRTLIVLAALTSGCATLSPRVPRFVVIYDQRTATACRIQVLRDTRSAACFVGFRCGRQVQILKVEPEVCVP